MSRFNAAAEVPRIATPQQRIRKKGTYADRSLGPTISYAADPPKRVQRTEMESIDVD